MTAKKDFSFILASASPRRKELLKRAGYRFEIVPSAIDELQFGFDPITPQRFAECLAFAKAKDVAKRYADKLVLGADTLVNLDGEIIGKASDEEDARRIIERLFSKPHKVITGVAVVKIAENIEIVKSDTTIVYPKKMTAEDICEHIKGGTWQDKAGAYAIQETGDKFVKKIEGSLTNVMGLPMELIEEIFLRLQLLS